MHRQADRRSAASLATDNLNRAPSASPPPASAPGRGKRPVGGVYRKTARNFAPVMATAATTTVVQVDEVVPTGDLDPEAVVTPSVYVDRMVRVEARHYAVQ